MSNFVNYLSAKSWLISTRIPVPGLKLFYQAFKQFLVLKDVIDACNLIFEGSLDRSRPKQFRARCWEAQKSLDFQYLPGYKTLSPRSKNERESDHCTYFYLPILSLIGE
jgi:hypothetical protein